MRENDVDVVAPDETAQLRVALETLTRHTRTPDDCYFCLWDGWGDIEGGDAPELQIIWQESGGPPVEQPTRSGFGRFEPRGVPIGRVGEIAGAVGGADDARGRLKPVATLTRSGV